MNEWINDELLDLARAAKEQEASDRRVEVIRNHTLRVWEQIRMMIKDAAEQMNQIPELKQRTGGLNCMSGYSDRIEVTKASYPAIYLTVRPGPSSIDIHRTVVTNGADRHTQEQAESLDLELDTNGQPYLKNKEGKPLLVDEAVRYIFQPFIYPERLELKRPIRIY